MVSSFKDKPRFVGEKVRLGDVLKVVHGKNQKAVKDDNGKYPIYGSGGQMGWANSYICPENTVIIGRKGNINKPIFVAEPFWNVDTAFGLVADARLLNARYLFHFCEFFDFEKLNTTCTIPSLTRKNVVAIELQLPSIKDQEIIVRQLDSILACIEVAKRKIGQLDQLVKSRFVEMFGDPFDNEKSWKELPLGAMLDIARGGSPRPIKDYITDDQDGINWIKIGDAVDGSRYIEKTAEKIRPSGVKKSRMVKSGDFLLSNSMSFGRPYILKTDGCIHDGWLVLHGVDRCFNSLFLYQLLASEGLLRKFSSLVRGGVVNNLNKDLVASVEVMCPPIEMQNSFADFVAQVDKPRFAILQQIEKLETLKASLMQEYFG